MKKTILFFTLLAVVAFSSCDSNGFEKDIFDKDGWGKDDQKDETDKKDKEICFELVYPVTYTMPDDSAITGNDEKELWTAIKAWYEAHPDVAAKPSLNYPVNIVFVGKDEIHAVANEEEMIEIKKKCDWDKEECFELVYPVTYTMPDESTITGNDEKELWTAIKAWYEAHPDVAAKPSLNYPVNIVFVGKDGIHAVANEEEMIEIKKKCDGDKEICFELVYPVTYTMPDGSTITGEGEAELWTAIKAWYEAHPDVAAKPSLNYPVNIVFEDGLTQTIVNENEMSSAKEECED